MGSAGPGLTERKAQCVPAWGFRTTGLRAETHLIRFAKASTDTSKSHSQSQIGTCKEPDQGQLVVGGAGCELKQFGRSPHCFFAQRSSVLCFKPLSGWPTGVPFQGERLQSAQITAEQGKVQRHDGVEALLSTEEAHASLNTPAGKEVHT